MPVLHAIYSDSWLESAIRDWRVDFQSNGTPAKVKTKPVLDLTPLAFSGSLRFHDPAKSVSICKSMARLSKSGMRMMPLSKCDLR